MILIYNYTGENVEVISIVVSTELKITQEKGTITSFKPEGLFHIKCKVLLCD